MNKLVFSRRRKNKDVANQFKKDLMGTKYLFEKTLSSNRV
ncbi:hypothetical protein CWATWH8502_2188 [Crocosphaera watsonii WH 8502]|uniref:Uncharacterized protein n=5 Tax=Crocosphaera watsonii TaxID=263511 RepID=T2JX93_CROWT|nr:hypothetical protein CWATWH0003_3014 [Crocosphaera watsonii WH 0003]CCQ52663.1 hypothetical protein CWATWH8502_2188 [Crocosphaera watsonii WH 8502]CCQ56182.1 hypothetical protein CWATWH0005_5063 [Crocosphaera watsonii WH 0005]CCQ64536.1 hypothetical protein CWATWH0401_4636 [Crocosphaera watsonii WH 0401]CCQ70413.1 hypothetical protein CWATWH0402_1979 [Crocosphaera watsonii WH 0402]